MKFLAEIIREQNRLLNEARQTIIALSIERDEIRAIALAHITGGQIEGEDRVKSLMVLKGVKQVDICRKLHVTPQTVSLIVSGKKKSARIRAAIAKALGVKVEDLWPNGNNNHKRAA
jgi:DNA-binding XRE family transcriptional regulator